MNGSTADTPDSRGNGDSTPARDAATRPAGTAEASRTNSPSSSGFKSVNNPSQATQAPDSRPQEEGAAAETSASTAAAPYGTRSRNRTSGARINYAEDKDLDMEAEVSGAAPMEPAPKRSAQSQTNGHIAGVESAEEKVTTSGTRRSGGFAAVNTATATNGTPSSNSKDALPGATAQSAASSHNHTSTTGSKKRKQPGSNVTASTQAGNQAAPRARGAAAAAAYTESNMMSFEKFGAFLKNGKLKADDGTTLGINGRSCRFQVLWPLGTNTLAQIIVTSSANLLESHTILRVSCSFYINTTTPAVRLMRSG